MAKYDENMYILKLPAACCRELYDELSKDSGWIILTRYLADECNMFSTSWMNAFEREIGTLDSVKQIQKLFNELHNKLCTVGFLCRVLEECELLNALSILCYSEPLKIVEQPKSELGKDNASLAPGERISLNCEAISLPPPQYLWYHNNVELENERKAELNIVVTSAAQEGEYRCKVMQKARDGYLMEQLFSDKFYVKVKPMPVVIIEEPIQYLELKERDTLILTCKANGHPGPRYRWFRDFTELNEQNSNVLRINQFSNQDEGEYRCLVQNQISELYSRPSRVKLELPRYKAVAKVALLIANYDYQNLEKLEKPKNDAALIARLLYDIGFKVISLANLTVNQMRKAIQIFSKYLSEGVYGVFYFAGHGFYIDDNYMLAVDSPEKYLRSNAVGEKQFLSMAHITDPTLLIAIMDMCLTIPPREDNPELHKEVPRVYEYESKADARNLIYVYSTCRQRPSYEKMSDDFGFYAKHLREYIQSTTLPAADMFKEVHRSIDKALKGRERNQTPTITSTVVNPYRLTDGIKGNSSEPLIFPSRTISRNVARLGLKCEITVGPFEKFTEIGQYTLLPYFNFIRIDVGGVNDYEISFYNLVPTRISNLNGSPGKNSCVLYYHQTSKGVINICFRRNGELSAAIEVDINDCIPPLLRELNEN